MKAIHREGPHMVFMMDASAAQIQGLGDCLLKINMLAGN